ncbi:MULTISPECIES: hypothetical protein [Kaistella]|uniref:hypothetical protein n=1 Tax=Kaistella TaxID=2782231 RepID=UPI0025B468F1|nr:MULTISPECIES: hypothetical protein [Kaistella]MDN3606766.1 hypothetical protein [Kaistella yonginensis]MDP2454154.1 hypothetical protein [Kaistella sp. SH11-4b]MDP2457775.1 hypothetical protein [Kaistella sp. SH40-3]MDP2460533.1 hypothetical protein [Kaistella sp. SH19-2b]
MSQLIEFKGTFIRICPTNPSHLLQLKDRGKSWSLLYDGSETMNSIMQIAADNTIILLFCNKGFFISKSGIVWTKIRDRQQLEDLKTDYEI